jgi:hypothetical protein
MLSSRRPGLPASLLLAACFVLGVFERNAEACTPATLQSHVVDPALVGVDSLPPSPPARVVATVERRLGMQCFESGCLSSSCGDTASVALTFTEASDDQTAADVIGYQLISDSRALPEALADAPAQRAPTGRLVLRLGFDEAGGIDLIARLVAIDAAGNVSAPSEPFSVRYSGCTHPLNGDTCTDADTTSCSLARVANSSLPPNEWAALGLLALFATATRRSYAARRLSGTWSA